MLPHGTIFLEPRLEEFVTDSFKLFYLEFCRLAGWKMLFDSVITKSKIEGEIVLINNMPVANFPFCGTKLDEVFDFNGKVILFLRDVHTRNNVMYIDKMSHLMDRANLIISFSREHFHHTWRKWEHKHVWFPIYFAPTTRFVRVDENPLVYRKHKCLVPGLVLPNIYPVRHLAASNPLCETIPMHPKYDLLKLNQCNESLCIRDRYADLLHEYCCALTDGSIYNYLLQKHMEIPACGTLLISNRFPDLDKAGFVPEKHYVEVDGTNCGEKILEITSNPHHYQNIAINGQRLVMQNYTMEHALTRLAKILMERL